MKILLTGGTGFIGTKLSEALLRSGHELIILTRNSDRKNKKNVTYYPFDYAHDELPCHLIQDLDGVINLAGEDLSSSRWNAKKKEMIRSSRILFSKKLVEELNTKLQKKLSFFLSASAIGIYAQTKNDVIFDEQGQLGTDFLSQVCRDWEAQVNGIHISDVLMITRLGIVLGKEGGALKKALPVFLSGTGGRLGSGEQWMSWIHIEDLVSAFLFLIDKKKSGIYNLTAPYPVTNAKFTEDLGHVLHRPSFVAVPETMIRLMTGEMATLLLSSQRIIPKQLSSLKFSFKYEHLLPALESILKSQP